ncbi:DNA primase large subunit-like isoform X1 [Hylaeus volcanicus]|uniref:DNA primase large subunit-like isoform X1 n=1 Tax=Hylaeus volcanicus TaxID=313075 RepID=UPI0023B7CAD5|nr:DNA primase large subunit-like isoform X1 [Hylaeus volcanicus]XP_053974307.1 DNA primase large subunit-like isoform X1 [Hylaeus volcanicus]
MARTPIRRHLNIEIAPKVSEHVFPHNLQMYSVLPSGEIKLQELQQWCVDRLNVLKLVEKISNQNKIKASKDYAAILIEQLINNELHNFEKLVCLHNFKSEGETEQYLRRNDCISHLILRSAFSFEHEKRLWFLRQELKLFRWRLSLLDKDNIKAFICTNGLQYDAISEEEKENIIEDVKISYDTEHTDNINVYKVHFTRVINAVKKRKIFLKDGMAYVPETKMPWLIIPEFKKKLNEGFAYSREVVANVYGDERLSKIFSVLSSCISIRNFESNNLRQVSIGELDELSTTSYPLCMRVLHEALKENHHLTNGGRVQYILFLKGIGLSLNDALEFMKNEFTKKIDENTFRKKYRYNVRHLYGQEGKRANYEPFHCIKIQNSSIGVRDKHGCPFKCMSPDVLKNTLHKSGLISSDRESVIQLSRGGYYLEACKKYFEITHNCITHSTFDHPNLYFNYSRNTFESAYSDSED